MVTQLDICPFKKKALKKSHRKHLQTDLSAASDGKLFERPDVIY